MTHEEDILNLISQIVRCGHQHDDTVKRNVFHILHDLVRGSVHSVTVVNRYFVFLVIVAGVFVAAIVVIAFVVVLGRVGANIFFLMTATAFEVLG